MVVRASRFRRSLNILQALGMIVAMTLASCGKPTETARPSTAVPERAAPAPPSADSAKELIASSAEWSEFQFTHAAYTLPLKRSAMNDPARKAAGELSKAGWIRMSGDEVVLTSKAQDDKRFLVRPNGVVDIVPIARKDLRHVENVRTNPDETVSADVTWRWLPNEVGNAFKSGVVKERFDATHRAVVTLIPDGDRWTVLRIVPLE